MPSRAPGGTSAHPRATPSRIERQGSVELIPLISAPDRTRTCDLGISCSRVEGAEGSAGRAVVAVVVRGPSSRIDQGPYARQQFRVRWARRGIACAKHILDRDRFPIIVSDGTVMPVGTLTCFLATSRSSCAFMH
jgi:hypothetical protein